MMVPKIKPFSYDDLPDPQAALFALKEYAERRARDNREIYHRSVTLAISLEHEADGVEFEELTEADELRIDRQLKL